MENNQFELFVKQILSQNKIWLLQATDGLFAMLESADRTSYLPIWASELLAVESIKEEWEEYQIAEMDVPELVTWLNELIEDGMKIGMVIDSDQKILPVEASSLQEILIAERKRNQSN